LILWVLETINQTMFVVGTPRPCQEFLGFIKVHKDLEAQVAPDVGDLVCRLCQAFLLKMY
jgi:hypothetical protein